MTCALCHVDKPPEELIKSQWACKPCWRAYMRHQRYGITAPEFDRLLKRQGGVCAICGGVNTVEKKGQPTVRNLAVDHGPRGIRGLLCGKCNRGLGYFGHDTKLLHSAIRYLVGWPMSSV